MSAPEHDGPRLWQVMLTTFAGITAACAVYIVSTIYADREAAREAEDAKKRADAHYARSLNDALRESGSDPWAAPKGK